MQLENERKFACSNDIQWTNLLICVSLVKYHVECYILDIIYYIILYILTTLNFVFKFSTNTQTRWNASLIKFFKREYPKESKI